MNQEEVIAHIQRRTMEPNQGWWINAAYSAILGSAYNMLSSRQDPENVYLARFWLNVPQFGNDHSYDFGNSSLLHFILKDDDEEALHDHPCDFRTQILSGGYTESLPTNTWQVKHDEYCEQANSDCHTFDGPQVGAKPPRKIANVIIHKATDLHRAINVLPDTWTLVTTGEKIRQWGFWPPGEPWQNYKDYLGISANSQ